MSNRADFWYTPNQQPTYAFGEANKPTTNILFASLACYKRKHFLLMKNSMGPSSLSKILAPPHRFSESKPFWQCFDIEYIPIYNMWIFNQDM